MKLLINSLKSEVKSLIENDIKLSTIGNIERLPKSARNKLLEVKEKTAGNKGMTLTLALSYGSREEIIHAIKDISSKVKDNVISIDNIDESIINQHLYTRNLPDVDLLIRTSGEHRISNFLLWQIAYAELYFTKVLWPDFGEVDFYEAIISYQNRERRFGKTSEQIK
jgi:undecaprenyl diphosphate synthase